MREHKARLPWPLGKLFRAYYDSIIDEPLPDRWVELIRTLDDRERVTRNSDHNAESGAAQDKADSRSRGVLSNQES